MKSNILETNISCIIRCGSGYWVLDVTRMRWSDGSLEIEVSPKKDTREHLAESIKQNKMVGLDSR